ncbi:MAG: (4Fe-4S)-binding protein [Bacteroidia bacterium]
MTEKLYKKDEFVVVWKPSLCIHSANCVKNSPLVFDSKRKPWIELEHESADQILNTVKKCPSGALTYYMESSDTSSDNNKETMNKEEKTIVKVMGSGPLILSEGCTIEYKGEMIQKEGVVALCRCGMSSTKPFCDGAHKREQFID